MDIAEVARRAGVPASTLRYYEARGLIASIGRAGLRRVFDAGVLQRLALIALGRAAGFSLDEIAGMFAADGQPVIDRARRQGRRRRRDAASAHRAARRPAPRRALPGAQPSRVSDVPAPAAECLIGRIDGAAAACRSSPPTSVKVRTRCGGDGSAVSVRDASRARPRRRLGIIRSRRRRSPGSAGRIRGRSR